MARRKRSRKNPKRSRRAKRVIVRINPPKRRRHKRNPSYKRRRSYRRNPGLGGILPGKPQIFDAVYVTGGLIGTKIAANFVLPMIGIQQPIVRIGVKAVLAGALGFLGKRFLGQNAGSYLMIGGLVETVNDAVQTYVSPYVPALAVSAYPELIYNDVGVYPGMGAYPDLSGMVTDDTMETV